MDGFYNEAKPYFEQVLNLNGSFLMAYQAIADSYYKQRDFNNALANYRYAEDRRVFTGILGACTYIQLPNPGAFWFIGIS
jgi:tetratricopeptide (TPR) repeat protein